MRIRLLLLQVGFMDTRIGFLLLLVLGAGVSDARELLKLDLHGEVSRNDNVCMFCEEYTSQALDFIGANKTQEAIIEMLHKSCSRVPSYKEECITMVDYYAPLFFLEISSIQPEEFCRKFSLCEQMALISSKLQEDSCDFCHRAVSEVLEKLKDPDMQMDIIQMLLKACNSMEKYAKKCKRLVFEYGPLILANAEQFLETTDICTALHACQVPAAKIGEAVAIDDVSGLSDS